MTKDFFLGQLRLMAIAIIAYASGRGWLSSADASLVTQVLTPMGVIAGPWLWSLYTNFNTKFVPANSVAVVTSADVKKGDVLAVSTDGGSTVADVAKVVGCILATLFVLGAAPDASAQSRLPIPLSRPDNSGDLLTALDAKLLPDLQYALALAQANDSKVTAPCYRAWIDIIEKRQAAVKDMTPPTPGLVTKFEKAVQIRNAIQSDSAFMLACSPVANMVKKDVLGLVGMFAGGALSLGTLVPGL